MTLQEALNTTLSPDKVKDMTTEELFKYLLDNQIFDSETDIRLFIIEGVQRALRLDDEFPIKVYTKEDMTKIINAFKKHTLYHTTYFNAAKHFIMSQSNINDINLFSYGTDISDTVEDAVLRQILKNGDAQQ